MIPVGVLLLGDFGSFLAFRALCFILDGLMTFSRVIGDEEAKTSAAAEDEAMVIDLDPPSKVKFREFFIAEGWCVPLSTMVNFEYGLIVFTNG